MSERDELLEVLAAQRMALRNAVRRLSAEQAAATPTASELCVGGLIKHSARTERGWVAVRLAGRPDLDPASADSWSAEFHLSGDETVEGYLARYEEIAAETEQIIRALPNLDVEINCPRRPGIRRTRPGRRGGFCCTSSPKRPAMPGMPTSSVSRSTAPPRTS